MQPTALTVFVLFCSMASFTLLFISYDCEFVWSVRNAVNKFSRFNPRSRGHLRPVNVTEIYERLDLRVGTPICRRLFRASKNAQMEAMNSTWTTHNPVPEEAYPMMAQDCREYRTRRGYAMSASAEELVFPLAFSILLYRDVELAERLLRAIYRPQNVYCLHVDRKSTVSVHEAASAIASCFENVFIVPSPVSVAWGTVSVIEAELSCLHLLWNYKQKWKYFINLTGQEYPLKTNVELVRILQAYDGANDIQFQVGMFNKFKMRTSYKCTKDGQQTELPYRAPPLNMRVAVGSTHMAVSRAFIDFALHNKTARVLLNWVKDTCIPDETYFPMLNVNPQLGVPGAYTGNPQIFDIINVHFTRFKIWKSQTHQCQGRDVRSVCIQNVFYLPVLKHAREMFVNKFHMDYQPLALRCLEELMYDRVLQDIHGQERHLDLSIYREANFVKHRLRVPTKG